MASLRSSLTADASTASHHPPRAPGQFRPGESALAGSPVIRLQGADQENVMSTLAIILIVLLVLALGAGGLGGKRYGTWSWSPAAIIVVVAVLLLVTGNLRL